MELIAIKTENGKLTGEIAFYCRVLKVSRQGFYNHLEAQEKPWKYEALAAEMYEIIDEDECNDTYGRYRMHKALELKKETKDGNFHIYPAKGQCIE
jgi:putative transposase